MNFHSAAFALFLAASFAAFWLAARARGPRTALLLAASYGFYSAWSPLFLALLVFSTLLDYACGGLIARSASPSARRAALCASLAGNLGLLAFFKYYDWGAESLARLAALLGLAPPLAPLQLVVPVGISFYTFQSLSYTIDLYRGAIRPARNLADFALFVAFFPQLVAGPIVRAAEFLPQLERAPRFELERFQRGLYRVGRGVVKKVLVADVLGRLLVDPVYADPGQYTPAMHALACYAFAFQIYFDFSGYTDIAIGAARLFGFELPENFDLPHRARSVREFWRRWHMTLSAWLRDYLYFPLGGSRRPEPRVVFNLMLTMLLIGLWHGASWLWALYGLVQGAVMCVERQVDRRLPALAATLRGPLGWLVTFHVTVLTMVAVRARSFAEARAMLTDFGEQGSVPTEALLVLAVAAASHFAPRGLHAGVERRLVALPTMAAGVALGLAAGFAAFVAAGETPFIYFRF